MKIAILAKGLELTDALREHVERRLNFALDRAHYHIDKVSVRLSDENGPRGGEDKRCQVQVHLAGTTPVLVEDTELDLYRAIDRAADRTGHSLARQLGRQRRYRRETHRGALPISDDTEIVTELIDDAAEQLTFPHLKTGAHHAHPA